MSIKDRLNKHTISTKLSLVEEDMLTKPLTQWDQMYKAREKYDVTKPVPYDMHEDYEEKKAAQSKIQMTGESKLLDTTLQRIAFHKYQDYSIAQMTRERLGAKYNKMANHIAILSEGRGKGTRFPASYKTNQAALNANKN